MVMGMSSQQPLIVRQMRQMSESLGLDIAGILAERVYSLNKS
jgi:hypothetical protein